MNNILSMIVALARDRVKLQMNQAILRDISGNSQLSHLLPLLDDSTMISIERAIMALEMPDWVKGRIIESELSDPLSDVLVEIERKFGYSATLLFRWGTLLERLPWFAGVTSALKPHNISRPDQETAFQYLTSELRAVLQGLGISEEWVERIANACREGDVKKANEYLEAVHAQIERNMEHSNGNSSGDKSNTITIVLENTTIHGPLSVASSIQHSFNQVTQSIANDNLRELVKDLVIAVGKMTQQMPAEQAEEVAEDIEKLVEEASRERPRRRWWSVSVEGLTRAARNLGEIGKPVLDLLERIVPLLLRVSV